MEMIYLDLLQYQAYIMWNKLGLFIGINSLYSLFKTWKVIRNCHNPISKIKTDQYYIHKTGFTCIYTSFKIPCLNKWDIHVNPIII